MRDKVEQLQADIEAGWSGGDPKIVKATAERVVGCARDILRAGLLEPAAQQQAEAA